MKYLFALIIPFLALNAKATVIGFDDVSGANPMSSQQFGSPSYTEHAMTFKPIESSSTDIIRQGTSCGYASDGPARSPCTNDGSPHFLLAANKETYQATLNNGDAFDLISVELTNYSWAPSCYTFPLSVTFDGNLMSGGTVSQTFATDAINSSDPYDGINDFETFFFSSDFVNLRSLDIVSSMYSLDNLSFEAAVPEPSSVMLMTVMGVGGWLFRRKLRR